MSMRPVLEALADGQFHSGQELGGLLGVSRTAVWKQLRKLEELGLSVEAVKGRGYRLPGGVNLLREERIRDHLEASANTVLHHLVVHSVVDSTNAEVQRRMGEAPGSGHGMVCCAEYQQQGRGRRGRNWVSPYGRNLYLSVGWRFDGGAAALEGLSLAVGIALIRVLKTYELAGVGLKWPNDVMVGGRKLAGILIEMAGDVSGSCHVVIGIGLNVAMPGAAGAAISQQWADLEQLLGGVPERNRLLGAVLSELVPVLAHFDRSGFSAFREEWQEHDIYRGREVVAIEGQQTLLGEALGVDVHGALVLRTSGGERRINGGEVSLRAHDS